MRGSSLRTAGPCAITALTLMVAFAGCSSGVLPHDDGEPSSTDAGDGGLAADTSSSSPLHDGAATGAAPAADASDDATPNAAPTPSDAASDAHASAIDATDAATLDAAWPPGTCANIGATDAAPGPLPGCGTWVSGPSNGIVGNPLQLTASGRTAAFGATVDWNLTGGAGSGVFSNTSLTSATFTCVTPGSVIVTASDPAGTGCGAGVVDQASVAIECDAFDGPWASIALGAESACGVATDGSAHCWANSNFYGALGNGSLAGSDFPVPVSGLTSGVQSVAVGEQLGCALTVTGGVQCWGEFPDSLAESTPLAAPVTGLPSSATAVAVGSSFACAATASNGVLCWGDGGSGELGASASSSTTPVAITGLTSPFSNVVAGDQFACVLSTTGVVQCWGDNSSGQLGPGVTARTSAAPALVTGLPGSVTAIAAGGSFACALTSAGDVYCWGDNEYAELGSAGPSGTSGSTSATPLRIAGLPSGVRSVATGENFACALTSSGAVLCWGNNGSEQLGAGIDPYAVFSSETSAVPVMALASGITSIALGGEAACALTAAGDLLCWGSNEFGQTGESNPVFCPLSKPTNGCSPYPGSLESTGRHAVACGPAPADPRASDAARGWCLKQGTHTLCEDFDQGVPGAFATEVSTGSTVITDSDSTAGSQSLLAITSPIAPDDVESFARGAFVSPVSGTSFTLQADFRVGSDCFANETKAVTLARVDYTDVGYTLAISVDASLFGAGFILQPEEVETTPETPGPFGGVAGGEISVAVGADQWARLSLSATLGAGGGTGSYGIAPLESNGPGNGAGGGLFGPTATPVAPPELHIGVDAAVHGCTVDIDNVLFDVR